MFGKHGQMAQPGHCAGLKSLSSAVQIGVCPLARRDRQSTA